MFRNVYIKWFLVVPLYTNQNEAYILALNTTLMKCSTSNICYWWRNIMFCCKTNWICLYDERFVVSLSKGVIFSKQNTPSKLKQRTYEFTAYVPRVFIFQPNNCTCIMHGCCPLVLSVRQRPNSRIQESTKLSSDKWRSAHKRFNDSCEYCVCTHSYNRFLLYFIMTLLHDLPLRIPICPYAWYMHI